MKKDHVKRFQQLLVQKKAELMANVTEEEREGRDAVTIEAKDFADMATEASGQEYNFVISDAGRKILRDINDALLRIREGTYGNCERCDKPIDVSRLDVLPHARMCITCQEAVEKEGAR
ncbi:MAG: TraR/DksA family transcriptional regulator [bacterium]